MFKIKYITYSYLLILLIGTLIPLTPISHTLNDNYTLHIRWDYLLHVMVYLPLPFLMWLSLRKDSPHETKSRLSNGRFLFWIVLVPLLVASLFEALQLIVPYRRFNINDMFASCMGAIIGLILIPVFKRFISRLKWI